MSFMPTNANITKEGLTLDGKPFPYPIEEGGISITPEAHGYNRITVTIPIHGPITINTGHTTANNEPQ